MLKIESKFNFWVLVNMKIDNLRYYDSKIDIWAKNWNFEPKIEIWAKDWHFEPKIDTFSQKLTFRFKK